MSNIAETEAEASAQKKYKVGILVGNNNCFVRKLI